MASIEQNTALGGYVTKFDVLNKSTAKSTYSFSKQQRFPSVKKPATTVIGYDLPSPRSKRAAGFGIGNRFKTPLDQREKSNSPSPGNYNHKSEFEIGRPGTTACISKAGIYSFGVGRDRCNTEKVYVPSRRTNNDPNQPGPGTYTSTMYSVGTEGRKFAFQGRTKNTNEPLHLNVKKNTPGPGSYGNGVEINKYGVYRLSTIENSRAAAWSPSKKRFQDDIRFKRDLPGPGDYNPSDCIDGVSQYLLSNFKSYGTRKFMPDANDGQRQLKLKSGTPGPGSYIAPSDFGYLEMTKRENGSPRSPKSSRRVTQTAINSTRVKHGRRDSFLSHRNSQTGGSELRNGRRNIKGLQTPNEYSGNFARTAGPGQFSKYVQQNNTERKYQKLNIDEMVHIQ